MGADGSRARCRCRGKTRRRTRRRSPGGRYARLQTPPWLLILTKSRKLWLVFIFSPRSRSPGSPPLRRGSPAPGKPSQPASRLPRETRLGPATRAASRRRRSNPPAPEGCGDGRGSRTARSRRRRFPGAGSLPAAGKDPALRLPGDFSVEAFLRMKVPCLAASPSPRRARTSRTATDRSEAELSPQTSISRGLAEHRC